MQPVTIVQPICMCAAARPLADVPCQTQEAPLGEAAATQRDIKGYTPASLAGGRDSMAMMVLYSATLALVVTGQLMAQLPDR